MRQHFIFQYMENVLVLIIKLNNTYNDLLSTKQINLK